MEPELFDFFRRLCIRRQEFLERNRSGSTIELRRVLRLVTPPRTLSEARIKNYRRAVLNVKYYYNRRRRKLFKKRRIRGGRNAWWRIFDEDGALEKIRTIHLRAHRGRDGIETILREKRIHIPNVRGKIATIIQRCPQCSTTSRTNTSYTPLRPIRYDDFGSHWEFDYFQYARFQCLLGIDGFSKIVSVWVNLFQSGEDYRRFIDALRQRYHRIGGIQKVHTDNGGPFTSRETIEHLRRMGIERVRSLPRNPRCLGLAERANQTIKRGIQNELLSRNVLPNQISLQDMRAVVDRVVERYNESPHTSLPRFHPPERVIRVLSEGTPNEANALRERIRATQRQRRRRMVRDFGKKMERKRRNVLRIGDVCQSDRHHPNHRLSRTITRWGDVCRVTSVSRSNRVGVDYLFPSNRRRPQFCLPSRLKKIPMEDFDQGRFRGSELDFLRQFDGTPLPERPRRRRGSQRSRRSSTITTSSSPPEAPSASRNYTTSSSSLPRATSDTRDRSGTITTSSLSSPPEAPPSASRNNNTSNTSSSLPRATSDTRDRSGTINTSSRNTVNERNSMISDNAPPPSYSEGEDDNTVGSSLYPPPPVSSERGGTIATSTGNGSSFRTFTPSDMAPLGTQIEPDFDEENEDDDDERERRQMRIGSHVYTSSASQSVLYRRRSNSPQRGIRRETGSPSSTESPTASQNLSSVGNGNPNNGGICFVCFRRGGSVISIGGGLFLCSRCQRNRSGLLGSTIITSASVPEIPDRSRPRRRRVSQRSRRSSTITTSSSPSEELPSASRNNTTSSSLPRATSDTRDRSGTINTSSRNTVDERNSTISDDDQPPPLEYESYSEGEDGNPVGTSLYPIDISDDEDDLPLRLESDEDEDIWEVHPNRRRAGGRTGRVGERTERGSRNSPIDVDDPTSVFSQQLRILRDIQGNSTSRRRPGILLPRDFDRLVNEYHLQEGEEEDKCPICLEDLSSNPDDLVILPCQHKFHGTTCVKPWLCNHDSRCPICRGNVDLSIANATSNNSQVIEEIVEQLVQDEPAGCLDSEILVEELRTRNLHVLSPTQGDGNCLFTGAIESSNDSPDDQRLLYTHQTLRQAVARWLRQNEFAVLPNGAVLAEFGAEDDETFDDMLERIETVGEDVGNFAVIGLANVLNTEILVWNVNNEGEMATRPLRTLPNNSVRDTWRRSRAPINLVFFFGGRRRGHYQAVGHMRERSSTPPLPEPTSSVQPTNTSRNTTSSIPPSVNETREASNTISISPNRESTSLPSSTSTSRGLGVIGFERERSHPRTLGVAERANQTMSRVIANSSLLAMSETGERSGSITTSDLPPPPPPVTNEASSTISTSHSPSSRNTTSSDLPPPPPPVTNEASSTISTSHSPSSRNTTSSDLPPPPPVTNEANSTISTSHSPSSRSTTSSDLPPPPPVTNEASSTIFTSHSPSSRNTTSSDLPPPPPPVTNEASSTIFTSHSPSSRSTTSSDLPPPPPVTNEASSTISTSHSPSSRSTTSSDLPPPPPVTNEASSTISTSFSRNTTIPRNSASPTIDNTTRRRRKKRGSFVIINDEEEDGEYEPDEDEDDDNEISEEELNLEDLSWIQGGEKRDERSFSERERVKKRRRKNSTECYNCINEGEVCDECRRRNENERGDGD